MGGWVRESVGWEVWNVRVLRGREVRWGCEGWELRG